MSHLSCAVFALRRFVRNNAALPEQPTKFKSSRNTRRTCARLRLTGCFQAMTHAAKHGRSTYLRYRIRRSALGCSSQQLIVARRVTCFGRDLAALSSSSSMSRSTKAVLYFTLGIGMTLVLATFCSLESYATHSNNTRHRVKLLPGSHLPSDAWFKSVLSTPIGPNDFAAFGDAVGAVSGLLDVDDAAIVDTNEASHYRSQLKSAVLHLFPFMSAQYKTSFSSLQQHVDNSQGIVIPCFNTDFQFALHLITASKPWIALPECLQHRCLLSYHSLLCATVRNVFNSPLPIEIMYAGDHDLHPDKRNALTSLGTHIRTVDILNLFDEATVGLIGGGWAIKPFAVLASSFHHVIMADSDTVFLQPPEAAFSNPGYMKTGTLFFHDRVDPGDLSAHGGHIMPIHEWWEYLMHGRRASKMLKQSKFWKRRTRYEMESGVVVLNKGDKQVLLGMLFAAWMNTKKVRRMTTYKYTHGDKESYWMAFELAGIPYFFDKDYAGAIGNTTVSANTGRIMFCPCHLLHLDHAGKPFWYNGSLFKSKKEQKGYREWLTPQFWAKDTSKWQADCMLDAERHAGLHPMTRGGYGSVYANIVQEALVADAVHYELIE